MKKLGLLLAGIAICVLAGPTSMAEDVLPTTVGPLEERAPGSAPCLCGFDPDGGTFCSTAKLCEDLQECSDNLDCPEGYRCLTDNCCPEALGAGACVPTCDDVECINPGVCESFEVCEPPLLVELESFEAEWVDGMVTLTWTTAAEIENVGFRIFRARGDGSRIRKSAAGARNLELSLELVTQRLIPAQGDPLTGASYRYADGAPHRPGTVSYYLVDVDYSGLATLHGPVHVEIPRDAGRPDTGTRSR
jgi:hypothetical protein